MTSQLEPHLEPRELQAMAELGFIDHMPAPPNRCLWKIGGPEKCGKTHLACTAPPPVFYFSIDKGTEGVVEKFQSTGKQILVYEIKYEDGKTMHVYEPIWKAFRSRLDAALNVGKGTIVFDTFSELYELARYAHFGRLASVPPVQYPQVYPDLRRIVDDVYAAGMSGVFLTKMVPQFENKSVLEERGFSEMGFRVQCNVQVRREDRRDAETGVVRPVFVATVHDCRQNIGLTGMELASVNEDGHDRFNLEYLLWLVQGGGHKHE